MGQVKRANKEKKNLAKDFVEVSYAKYIGLQDEEYGDREPYKYEPSVRFIYSASVNGASPQRVDRRLAAGLLALAKEFPQKKLALKAILTSR